MLIGVYSRNLLRVSKLKTTGQLKKKMLSMTIFAATGKVDISQNKWKF